MVKEHIENARVPIITDREELDSQLKLFSMEWIKLSVAKGPVPYQVEVLLNTLGRNGSLAALFSHPQICRKGRRSEVDELHQEIKRKMPKGFFSQRKHLCVHRWMSPYPEAETPRSHEGNSSQCDLHRFQEHHRHEIRTREKEHPEIFGPLHSYL